MIKIALLVMNCMGGSVAAYQQDALERYAHDQPVVLSGVVASACTFYLMACVVTCRGGSPFLLDVCARPGTSIHVHATSTGVPPWWLPTELKARIGPVGQEPVVVRTPELWNYVRRCKS